MSACNLSGLRRGRPRLPATVGMASSSASKGTLSWTLAPVRMKASGIPRRSVIRWRLVPGLPRSVGFGPVAAPLFSPRWMNCPCRHGSSQSCPRPEAGAAIRDAGGPTRPLPANPAIVASRSRPSRTPSPLGASPTEYPCAAQTACPSVPHAPEQAVGRLWASEEPVAVVVR